MAALQITQVYVTGVTNTGSNTGTATAIVTGGTTPYSASSDGINYIPNTTTISGLSSGNHTIYIKDNNGTVVSQPLVIPTYPQITNLAVTNETGLGLHDGSISFNISGGTAPYYYSVDNINYQVTGNNPQFMGGLPHGNYTLYLYDSQSQPIHLTTPFTIQAYQAYYGCTDTSAINYDPNAEINDGSCVYIDPDDATTLNNLYENIDEFRLVLQTGEVYNIIEPKDWDKVNVVLKRDTTYHGVNYEFTDGDIKLRFDTPAGMDLLISEYAKYGNDGITRFLFGRDNAGYFNAYLDAYIDYNTYDKQENYISVGVKRKTFDDLLESKNETIYSVNNATPLPLHSKLIQRSTKVNQGPKVGTEATLLVNTWPTQIANTGTPPYIGYCTFLDFSQASINDLCPDAPLVGVYAENPIDVSEYIFKTDGGGSHVFNISFDVTLHIKLEQPSIAITSPRNGYWSYIWYLAVNDMGNSYQIASKSGYQGSRFNDIQISGSISKTLNLQQNDKVYLFGLYICEDRGNKKDVLGSLDINYSNISIVGNTIAIPTYTSCSMAFETAQSLINQSTKAKANLKSNLLGRKDIGYAVDGCAALLSYTNGYQIRGFDQSTRPMQTSFKDWLEGLDCMYGIGMGYELTDTGQFTVRIEKSDYFYQNTELILFDGVSDYDEQIDTSVIYNKIIFGYQKYTQNLPSSNYTLDEFNTLHNYETPIQSIKAELNKTCKQITSGYSIELTRRQQFTDAPVDSWTYDEDLFAIATVRDGAGGFKPERLDNFTASGILSPETAYNLRLTPKRMLSRWAKWINGCLVYKKSSDVLINSFVAKNGDLTSQLITPDQCDSTQQFTEGSDLYLGDLAKRVSFFEPTNITFKKRISWNMLSFLRRQFQSGNNGYISVVDCNGITQSGWLKELQYNPESELGSFTLQKIYVDLVTPLDCTTYSAHTFGDFEAATGLPIEIEQCLFDNFI